MTARLPALHQLLPRRVRRPRLGPVTRLATGLVSLLALVVLLVDALVASRVPDPQAQLRAEREAIVRQLATDLMPGLRGEAPPHLGAQLQRLLQADMRLRSIALVLPDGTVHAAGPHAQAWQLAPGAAATLQNMRAAVLRDGRPTGEVQVAFAPQPLWTVTGPQGLPWLLALAALLLLCFGAFHLYLRRALSYLDPSRVVPERVRVAFDTLTEAVVVLDETQRIVLGNRAFETMFAGVQPMVGVHIARLPGLATLDDPGQAGEAAPWALAHQTRQPVTGRRLRVPAPQGALHLILNCSPIADGDGTVRGCLLSLTDVTDLQQQTARLREALQALEASQEEIRRKNDELLLLATRDPLTGCLNRRALISEGQALLEAARSRRQPLSCIMCDIDHFKRINDSFGHAGGDLVLQAVAKALARTVRTGDVLARTGGEEFCIVLPDTDLAVATTIAERLRLDVEQHAGGSVRHLAELHVTMSFGVASLRRPVEDLDTLIDGADQALYEAKRAGRNRVNVRPATTPVKGA